MKRLAYFEAAQRVAEMVGFNHEDLKVAKFERHISPNLVPLYKCLTDLASFYATALQTVNGKDAKDYLIKRNIDQSMIKKVSGWLCSTRWNSYLLNSYNQKAIV